MTTHGEPFNVHIGGVIRELREAKGMTQGQVAQKIGTSTNSVWRWEHGESPITFHNLTKILEVVEIDLAEIYNKMPSGSPLSIHSIELMAAAKGEKIIPLPARSTGNPAWQIYGGPNGRGIGQVLRSHQPGDTGNN